jgi:hypothetical protein
VQAGRPLKIIKKFAEMERIGVKMDKWWGFEYLKNVNG